MLPRPAQIGQFLSLLGTRRAIDGIDPIEQFLSHESIPASIVREVKQLREGEDRVQVGVVR